MSARVPPTPPPSDNGDVGSMLQRLRPLLTRTAREELARIPAAQARVDLDDLLAEGAVGILKGWHRYQPGRGRSDSSYLMLWARTEMRRCLERNAHDLAVERAVSERARKVRAVRARLHAAKADDEGAHPEELITASQQGYQHRYGAKAATSTTPLTMSHVIEEAELATRLIPMQRLDDLLVDQSAACVTVADLDRDAVPQQQVVEQAASQALCRLVRDAIDELRLDQLDRAVIELTYGFPPFEHSHSVRQVAQQLNLDRRRVAKIVSTFVAAMSRPDGPVMARLSRLSPDDLDALGLSTLPGTRTDRHQ